MGKKPGQPRQRLRVCASCEWIFKTPQANDGSCPRCGFAHYGARYVYGRRAYAFAHSQQPWIDRKMEVYRDKVDDEISKIKEKE